MTLPTQGFGVSQKWKENYDNYYKTDESEWRWIGSAPKFQNIAALCRDIQHEKVLEIGSGEGALLRRMNDAGFASTLYSLEISQSSLSCLSALALPRLAEARLFDGYTIPYPDAVFDLAVLSHVVEHLEYPRRLLYEAARVARWVFVEVPLEHTARLQKDYSFDPVGHINFYSAKTIRRLLQTCGLRVEKQIVTNIGREAQIYMRGPVWGLCMYYFKELLLRVMYPCAASLVTYHCALLAFAAESLPGSGSSSGATLPIRAR
jgi:SAM-dependent methyltransferase